MDDELRARVEARRAAGEYPPGLEEEMDAHWQRVRGGRPAQRLEDLRASVADVPAGGLTLPPGNVADRVVQRSLAPLVHQLNDTIRAIRLALDRVVATVENDEVMGHIHSLWDTLAAHERIPDDAPTALRELARRVEALETAAAPPTAARGVAAVDDASLPELALGPLERWTAAEVGELVAAAAEKLQPGGRLTLDAAVLPHPAEWLVTLVWDTGFAAVEVARSESRYTVTATR